MSVTLLRLSVMGNSTSGYHTVATVSDGGITLVGVTLLQLSVMGNNTSGYHTVATVSDGE